MSFDLDRALALTVNGQRLGEMLPSALRILKLWIRNRLTAAPDDPQLLTIEAQIEMVIEHRRRHPLPRPTSVPHFDFEEA